MRSVHKISRCLLCIISNPFTHDVVFSQGLAGSVANVVDRGGLCPIIPLRLTSTSALWLPASTPAFYAWEPSTVRCVGRQCLISHLKSQNVVGYLLSLTPSQGVGTALDSPNWMLPSGTLNLGEMIQRSSGQLSFGSHHPVAGHGSVQWP